MIENQAAKLLKPKKIKESKENSILYKRGKSERAVFSVVFIIFAVYAVSLLLPLLWLIINSLKTRLGYFDDLNANNSMALPSKWMFSNYIKAFESVSVVNYTTGRNIPFYMMFFNSIWFSLLGTLSLLAASTLTAYCVAKYRFKLRGVLYGIAIFSMTIPIMGSSGAAFKLVYTLGIYNTPFHTLIVSFSGFGFQFLILYGFFRNVSWSYAEAVFIDGGGHATVFFKIMLPQALPTLVALGITCIMGFWNDYITPLLYLPDFPTLASGIYRFELSFTREGHYPIYYAGLIISVLPIVIMFACFSNIIMKNYSVGGLKG